MCVSDSVVLLLQNGGTALVWASYDGHVEVVQKLLDAGANTDAADEVI